MIKVYLDELGEYFTCEECSKKCYVDDCETDKWWDNDGNHRMIYKCFHCKTDNYD